MNNHVLVIDDDPALIRLTALVLRTEGYDVAAFTSAIEALSQLAGGACHIPAAVILDLNMPEMDGREFYRRSRADGLICPVLILSAYGAEAARQELGADAAVAKPFTPEVLIDALHAMLVRGAA